MTKVTRNRQPLSHTDLRHTSPSSLPRMPRIKPRQDSEAEERISHALDALHSDKNLSIRAAGRKYGVPSTTLTNRYHGRAKSKSEAHVDQQLLMVEEEKAIETWISRLGDAGILPRLSYLRQLAASIIQQRTPHESEVKIGEHWVARFLDRHPDLAHRYSTRIDNERASVGFHPSQWSQVLEILQHESAARTEDVERLKTLAERSDNLQEAKRICCLLVTSATLALAEKAIAEETVRQFTTAQKKSETDKRQISKARVLAQVDSDRLRKERLEQEKNEAGRQ